MCEIAEAMPGTASMIFLPALVMIEGNPWVSGSASSMLKKVRVRFRGSASLQSPKMFMLRIVICRNMGGMQTPTWLKIPRPN
jgi:hypothetical protein